MSGDRLDTAELVECGKNKCQLTCLRCQSKILPPGVGSYEECEFELESMNKETAGQKEMVRQFFRVEDMFDFDNLGFTNTVGKYKFLSCADCDVGPIGYHDLETKKSYVALGRVHHAPV